MPYSADVVRRARARLAEAKEDRESENRQHLAEAYEKVPRIRQIDMELRKTMAEAARSAFLQGTDSRAALEEVRERNLALQREREMLVYEHFEDGWLDDEPICEKCGGSGYIGTAMCECLQELCRQEQKKEVAVLSGSKDSFGQFRLDYYPDTFDARYGASARMIMEKNYQFVRKYAQTFSRASGSMLFTGGTGLGKTFLSACVAREVTERGFSAAYESSGRLFSVMEQARFASDEASRQQVEKYYNADLLILDDLGTEMPGQFVTASLYNLLNERILSRKAMLISTNLNIDEVGKRYSPQIASRLQGNFKKLVFVGDDIRALHGV